MRQLVLLVGLVSLAGWAGAQTPAPEVDQDEVLRLGNIVQRIGGHQDEEVDGFVQVMALPADDIDKWFISVVTMQGCAPCAKLKKDWATDPWLRALAKPDDPKTSWAHFNYYDKDDKSQQWRFEKLRITAYPTVLVQPPRSGKYGNPSTVVYQNTYGGDPQALASAITTAIRRYVATLPKQVQQRPDSKPPWQPTPKVEPPVLPDARPVFPDLRPNDPVVIPPELRPLQQVRSMFTDVLLVLGGASLPLVIGGLILGLKYIRARRAESGKPLLLDDAAMEQLLRFLRAAQTLAQDSGRAKADTEAARKAA